MYSRIESSGIRHRCIYSSRICRYPEYIPIGNTGRIYISIYLRLFQYEILHHNTVLSQVSDRIYSQQTRFYIHQGILHGRLAISRTITECPGNNRSIVQLNSKIRESREKSQFNISKMYLGIQVFFCSLLYQRS